jgi:hypothetical protein
MKRPLLLLLLLLSGLAFTLHSQAPPPSGPSSASPLAAPSAPTAPTPTEGAAWKGILGESTPDFDTGSDVFSWNGKSWNVSNLRVFRSRFEKYLNAAEQTSEQDLAYQNILREITRLLAPQNYSEKSLDTAWSLLPKASNFDIDAKLCDSLANTVYTVWQTQRESGRLEQANLALENQRGALEWNSAMVSGENTSGTSRPRDPAMQQLWLQDQQRTKELRLRPMTERLVEINALLLVNKAKKETTLLQAKVEFQSLLVQLFMQRRFQHVLIGTQFYRHVFADGDTQLKLDGEAKKAFMETSGMPPTLTILDSLASEAIRDVREGIENYTFLLDKKELAAASQRLGEAFIIGEYMPEVRSLSRDKKRQALSFTQKSNQLLSALEVKDFSLAEKLVKELQTMATDFDASKPIAAIETARTVSKMHLAKAKIAASSNDRPGLETELKAAAEMWPRNPELTEVSALIFNQADVQQQALNDLNRLISQKNFRQIFDDRARYIAATALYPDQQKDLVKVLESMQLVESAIIRASEIGKRGDSIGAWEAAEKAVLQFPDDPKLNQLRAQLTTEAAEFVRSLRTAQDLEEKTQLGSSLAWYLKSQRLYAPSEFAQEGIARLVKLILPEA